MTEIDLGESLGSISPGVAITTTSLIWIEGIGSIWAVKSRGEIKNAIKTFDFMLIKSCYNSY